MTLSIPIMIARKASREDPSRDRSFPQLGAGADHLRENPLGCAQPGEDVSTALETDAASAGKAMR